MAAGVSPLSDDLPPDLEDAITSLALLADPDLLQAAESQMSEPLAARLADLNWKGQATGLDDQEAEEASRLLRLYERTLLVRASAAKLLKDRGRDLPVVNFGRVKGGGGVA